MMIVEKKKLKELKKKSWAERKELEQLKKSSKKAKPYICHFYKKEGHFFRDCPEMEKLRKLSASAWLGNAWATPTRLTMEVSSSISFRKNLLGPSSRKRKIRKRDTYQKHR